MWQFLRPVFDTKNNNNIDINNNNNNNGNINVCLIDSFVENAYRKFEEFKDKTSTEQICLSRFFVLIRTNKLRMRGQNYLS